MASRFPIDGRSEGNRAAREDMARLAKAARVSEAYLRQVLACGAPYALAERLALMTGRPIQAFLGSESGETVARRRSRERRRARLARQALGAG